MCVWGEGGGILLRMAVNLFKKIGPYYILLVYDLQEEHKNYTKVLEQMTAAQKKCVADIAHHRYRIRRIMESLKKYVIEI